MMINLLPGTNSVWMSLREDLPIGSTASFKFTFTNDITGLTKVIFPTDLQPQNKWSRFDIGLSQSENLNLSRLNLVGGMWSYVVQAGTASLEWGKVIVGDISDWQALGRGPKNNGAIRR